MQNSQRIHQNQQATSYIMHRKEERGFNSIYANKHCPGEKFSTADLLVFKFLSTVLWFDVQKPTFDKLTLFTIFFIKSL